jgi:type I site-specific restriction-modification system R (restriction) subunit
VFGDYIDVYDILQSKEDKATVPIYYEARLAKIDLKPEERPKIDPNFEEVTEDAEESTKESLRRKWAQLEAMVGTDKRIALVAEDLVKHWEPTLKNIARELVSHVRKSVTIDWTLRESAQAQIRVLVRRILRKYGYPPDKQEKATQTVLEQAKLLCGDWAEQI